MNHRPAGLALLLGSWFLLNGAARGGPEDGSIPAGSLLVKGAWPSASDAITPLPEGGTVSNNVYHNRYFGLAVDLGPDWTQRFDGPPPSDSGYYVLAQIEPAEASRNSNSGHVLIAAEDLFFTPGPARNALELMNYRRARLGEDYKADRAPAAARMTGPGFVRLDYVSAAAGLQWHVVAVEIRCHVVEFTFTGRDAGAMNRLMQKVGAVKAAAEAGTPVCLKDYADSENLIEREDPVFPEARFNPIPVRIIIDRDGRVKHVHYLSAFPEQARIISETLSHWRFKPYLANGHPVDVETGITFGRSRRSGTPAVQ